MPAPRDPSGEIRMRLRQLAVEAGIDPGRLIEEWHARADAAAYGGVADAEQVALRHIEERMS